MRQNITCRGVNEAGIDVCVDRFGQALCGIGLTLQMGDDLRFPLLPMGQKPMQPGRAIFYRIAVAGQVEPFAALLQLRTAAAEGAKVPIRRRYHRTGPGHNVISAEECSVPGEGHMIAEMPRRPNGDKLLSLMVQNGAIF